MHKLFSRVGPLVIVGCFLGAYGCTVNAPPPSASDDDPTEPTEPTEQPTAAPTTTATAAPTTTTTAAPTTTTTTAPTTTTTTAPTTTTTTAPTTTAPVAVPSAVCTATSLHEVEPNDSPATANDLGAGKSFCGTVHPGEVDYVSFTLPAGAHSFSYSDSWTGPGAPTITLTADGTTVANGQQPPLKAGKVYVFAVSGGDKDTDYTIAIDYN